MKPPPRMRMSGHFLHYPDHWNVTTCWKLDLEYYEWQGKQPWINWHINRGVCPVSWKYKLAHCFARHRGRTQLADSQACYNNLMNCRTSPPWNVLTRESLQLGNQWKIFNPPQHWFSPCRTVMVTHTSRVGETQRRGGALNTWQVFERFTPEAMLLLAFIFCLDFF